MRLACRRRRWKLDASHIELESTVQGVQSLKVIAIRNATNHHVISMDSVSSKSSTRAPRRATRPSTATASLVLGCGLTGAICSCVESSTVGAGSASSTSLCEILVKELWCLDPLLATSKLRPDSVKEVVHVCGEDAGGLNHTREWASHEVGNGERCVWQIFGRHLDDEELYDSVWVFLGKGVDQRHAERVEQGHASQVDATSELSWR